MTELTLVLYVSFAGLLLVAAMAVRDTRRIRADASNK
jgi:hypothetical protein